jgi:hypothetical protein
MSPQASHARLKAGQPINADQRLCVSVVKSVPSSGLPSDIDDNTLAIEIGRIQTATTYYQVLDNPCTLAVARWKYRQLMRLFHPDKRSVTAERMAGGEKNCDWACQCLQTALAEAEKQGWLQSGRGKGKARAPPEQVSKHCTRTMLPGILEDLGALGSMAGISEEWVEIWVDNGPSYYFNRLTLVSQFQYVETIWAGRTDPSCGKFYYWQKKSAEAAIWKLPELANPSTVEADTVCSQA